MKRPEYVVTATNSCKSALAGEVVDTEILKSVFSRSGFTDGYLNQKSTKICLVTAQKKMLAQEKVLPTLTVLYKNERKVIPLNFHLELSQDKTTLTI